MFWLGPQHVSVLWEKHVSHPDFGAKKKAGESDDIP